MNVAQLIDPEWAQGGFAERWPRKGHGEPKVVHRTHEAHPPLRRLQVRERAARVVPVRNKPRSHAGSLAERVRVVLAKGALNTPELKALFPGRGRMQIGSALGGMVKKGHVARSGERGHYVYSLTDAGRARLPEA